MALTKSTDDMNIIQPLDNEPNDIGGLSPDALKAKFDEAGNKLKIFINDSLIPEVDAKFTDVEGVGRTTETIKKNADDITAIKGTGHTTETIKKNADDITNLEGTGRTTETVKQNADDIATVKGTGHTTETVKQNADDIADLQGLGRTTETVKQNADDITGLEGVGRTTETVKENADNIASLNSNKADKTDTYTKSEVDTKESTLQGSIGINTNTMNTHIASTSAHSSANISYSGPVTASKVNEAIDVLKSLIDALTSGGSIEEVIAARQDLDGVVHVNLLEHLLKWEKKIAEAKVMQLNPTGSNATVTPYPDNLDVNDPTNGLFRPGAKGVPPVNQVIKNGNFINTNEWFAPYGSIIASDNTVDYEVSTVSASARIEQVYTPIATHKYFAYGEILPLHVTSTRLAIGNVGSGRAVTPNVWNSVNAFIVADGSSTFRFYHATDYNYNIGDIVKYRNVFLIDMTANGIEDYSEEQMLNIVRNGYWEGTKTTALSYDTVSIGKNKFNKNNEILEGNYFSSDGSLAIRADAAYSPYYYKIKPNTSYSSNKAVYVVEYDLNKGVIQRFANGTTFNTSSNASYIRVSMYTAVTADFDDLLIEEDKGQTLGVYEAYTSDKTEFSVPRRMVSVDSVDDEITTDGKLIYRNSDNIDLSTLSWSEYASGHSVDYYACGITTSEIWRNVIFYNYTSDKTGITADFEAANSLIYYYAGNLSIRIKVPKTAYASGWTLGETQAWLSSNGVFVIHQLAQEETIEDGQQGFKAPYSIKALQSGDLVQIGVYQAYHTLSNENTITLPEGIVLSDITSVFQKYEYGVFEVDGTTQELKKIEGVTLAADGKSIILPSTVNGVVWPYGALDSSTYLNHVPTGDLAGNINMQVIENTLALIDLLKRVADEEVITDLALLNHELGIAIHEGLIALNTAHAASIANPHGVTKSQVGLGNVSDVAQMPLAGGTFTGPAIAQSSSSSTARTRNIIFTTSTAVSQPGDIIIKYDA